MLGWRCNFAPATIVTGPSPLNYDKKNGKFLFSVSQTHLRVKSVAKNSDGLAHSKMTRMIMVEYIIPLHSKLVTARFSKMIFKVVLNPTTQFVS